MSKVALIKQSLYALSLCFVFAFAIVLYPIKRTHKFSRSFLFSISPISSLFLCVCVRVHILYLNFNPFLT